mgnify:CR=1 FL=1
MHDTFYVEGGSAEAPNLLRTHTSPMQVRVMEQTEPPVRVIVPGRCYRYEATDASHEHTFHQVEGLMIDRKVSVGHLLDSMRTLLREILRRYEHVYCSAIGAEFAQFGEPLTSDDEQGTERRAQQEPHAHLHVHRSGAANGTHHETEGDGHEVAESLRDEP